MDLTADLINYILTENLRKNRIEKASSFCRK